MARCTQCRGPTKLSCSRFSRFSLLSDQNLLTEGEFSAGIGSSAQRRGPTSMALGMGILRPAMHGMFIDTESSAVQHAERAEHRVAVTFAGLTATGSGSESAAGAA